MLLGKDKEPAPLTLVLEVGIVVSPGTGPENHLAHPLYLHRLQLPKTRATQTNHITQKKRAPHRSG